MKTQRWDWKLRLLNWNYFVIMKCIINLLYALKEVKSCQTVLDISAMHLLEIIKNPAGTPQQKLHLYATPTLSPFPRLQTYSLHPQPLLFLPWVCVLQHCSSNSVMEELEVKYRLTLTSWMADCSRWSPRAGLAQTEKRACKQVKCCWGIGWMLYVGSRRWIMLGMIWKSGHTHGIMEILL